MSFFPNQIRFADSTALDAFGRLRTSSPTTLFDSQFEYGLCTVRCWDAAANGTLATPSSNGSASSGGNVVGPRDANTRMVPVTVSATDTHYAILQSRQYTRYIPGKSHLILLTGVFAAGAGATVSIVRRTSTSGTAVDNEVAQASWNIDPFDGTGPSGVTLDFTKTQILVIDAQWLGVGRVRVGFDVDGIIYPAHQFLNANSLTVPYTQSFNLPVRVEGRTTSTTTDFRWGYFDLANGIFLKTSRATLGGTVNVVCCSVQSEGGTEARGFPWGVGLTASLGVTTRRPVLSIRPKATFNSVTNRAHIELAAAELTASTNTAYYELVFGGTLTGASFASLDADSVVEYDTAATAIAGGKVFNVGYVVAGSGSTKGLTVDNPDPRSPLVLSLIDALTATQTPITVVCTSLSGTSNVTAALDWYEQVI